MTTAEFHLALLADRHWDWDDADEDVPDWALDEDWQPDLDTP